MEMPMNDSSSNLIRSIRKKRLTKKEIEKLGVECLPVQGDISSFEDCERMTKEIIAKLNEGKSFDEVKEEYKDSTTYEELGYKSYNANLESAYMEEMQKKF